MSFRHRIPRLANPNIVIRKARTSHEVDEANQLVFRNYVAEGYWDDDELLLVQNPWLHSENRDVFVAMLDGEVVGTFSIIHDSPMGLPSDDFQPARLRQFREAGDHLGEGSAFAVRTDRVDLRNLFLFLATTYIQYSLYCTFFDRIVQACRPRHASFYTRVMLFKRVGDITFCNYARRSAQLLTLDMRSAQARLANHYEPDGENGPSMYRFLLVDEHASIHLDPGAYCRSRHTARGEFEQRHPATPLSTYGDESVARRVPGGEISGPAWL